MKLAVISHQQVFIPQIKPEVKLISMKETMIFIILDLSFVTKHVAQRLAGDYVKERRILYLIPRRFLTERSRLATQNQDISI